MPRPRGASVRRRARTAERQIEALRLRLDGHSTVEVAVRLAISQPSAWALIRGGLNRWLAQADGLAEELFNIEFARLERERVRATETEATLLAHIADLKSKRFYKAEIPAVTDPRDPTKILKEAKTETRIRVGAVAEYRAAIEALIKVGEFRLRLSERMARLAGLDRGKSQESLDVETLAHELMLAAAEIRQEFEEKDRKMLMEPSTTTIDVLPFDEANGGGPEDPKSDG